MKKIQTSFIALVVSKVKRKAIMKIINKIKHVVDQLKFKLSINKDIEITEFHMMCDLID